MKHLFLIGLSLLLAFYPSFCTQAQNITDRVYVEGEITTDQLTEITIKKLGVTKSNERTEFKMPITAGRFSGSFPVSSDGFYKIEDGFEGHTIFVCPGDSIRIQLNVIPDLSALLAKGYIGAFHHLQTTNRLWGHHRYFDELAKREISNINYSLSDSNRPSPIKYKQKCDDARDSAVSLLTQYKLRGVVSEEFYKYALIEINCRYILWLCAILADVPRSYIPDNYFENINAVDFSDLETMHIVDNFFAASVIYNIYYLNYSTFDYKRWYTNISNEYNTAKSYFKGLLRDKILAFIVTDYSDKDVAGFEAVYERFKTDCADLSIRTHAIRIVEKNKVRIRYDKKDMITALLSASVTDSKGKTSRFGEMLKGKKYIIVDCWATWCKPCISQKPSLEGFENKYRDSVYFAYLSMDDDSLAWANYVQKENKRTDNQFFVRGGFKSDLAKVFDITSIPRYLFFKNEGRDIISVKLPIPLFREEFEIAIQTAIR